MPEQPPRSTMSDASLGVLLRQYRRAAGLSQEQLAERATLSARTLSNLERGVIAKPQAATLHLIADALALDPADRACLTAALAGSHSPQAVPASAPPPAVLPAPLSPLIAREPERAALLALLRRADVRLVTITGTGGVGKTRLALAVAHALTDAFADGVFFVSLAPVRDPELFLPTIAQTLGAPLGVQTPLDALTTHLRMQQVLLVLDNCEHLLAETVTVANLLVGCPRLRVLATSRAPLRLRGEHVYPLAPLAVPSVGVQGERSAVGTDDGHAVIARAPAVQVFAHYARAVQPEFTVTAANAAAVAVVCAQVDGLPLALELAASRLRVLTVAGLRARLTRRLPELMEGARDAPLRQQTLRETIAWSYELLTAAEQAVFARLAVCAGGATPEAIEAVAGAGAARQAEALVIQSLVTARTDADGGVRYGMLETVREYAWERLTARGETETTQSRHARYVLALAEEAEAHYHTADQLSWFDRLELEHYNIRSVLTWARDGGDAALGLRIACALARFWYTRTYLGEARAWLSAFLARDPAADARTQARAHFGAGICAWQQADHADALAQLVASAALWRDADDPMGLAEALSFSGAVYTDTGDYPQAVALQGEALALRRACGDRVGIAQSLNHLGNVLRHQGKREEALTFYQEGLAVRRALGDATNAAIVLLNIGQLRQEMGEYAQAETALQESLTIHHGRGDRAQIGYTLNSLGTNAYERGAFTRARDYHERARAIFDEMGAKVEFARALINLARLAQTLGDETHAQEMIHESLTLSRAAHHNRNVGYALLTAGDIAAGRGDWDAARAHYEEALDGFHAATNPLGTTEAIERLGLLTVSAGDVRGARLLGYCAAMRARLGTPTPPSLRERHRTAHARLRMTLSHEAMEAMWAAGADWSLDAAIAAAIATPRIAIPPDDGNASAADATFGAGETDAQAVKAGAAAIGA